MPVNVFHYMTFAVDIEDVFVCLMPDAVFTPQRYLRISGAHLVQHLGDRLTDQRGFVAEHDLFTLSGFVHVPCDGSKLFLEFVDGLEDVSTGPAAIKCC